MPIFRLTRELIFPDPRLADPRGILAIGGDLSPERLLLAYSLGIFPWYSRGEPILWWSPDPRMVLWPDQFHAGRSLRKVIKRGQLRVTADTCFAEVIDRCARIPRPGQSGTWITAEMKRAYLRLHELGFAHSIETFAGDQLVGGLYGVSLGAAFFGESMFADAPDASKVAFTLAVEAFRGWGFQLIDCQTHTDHLERFGAVEISRDQFMDALSACLVHPTRRGPWTGLIPAPTQAPSA